MERPEQKASTTQHREEVVQLKRTISGLKGFNTQLKESLQKLQNDYVQVKEELNGTRTRLAESVRQKLRLKNAAEAKDKALKLAAEELAKMEVKLEKYSRPWYKRIF